MSLTHHRNCNVAFFVTSRPAEALKTIVGAAVAGVSVLSLCEKGDAFIMAETGKIFKKEKELKKGKCLLAFISPHPGLCDPAALHFPSLSCRYRLPHLCIY